MSESVRFAPLPVNTLPLPVALLLEAAPGMSHSATSAPAVGLEIGDDLFPKGDIVKFFSQQAYGFMRDHIGRELFFHLDEIDLLGPRGRREFMRVGLRVGFDCCRTSHGLRVKRMKIY